MSSIPKDKVRFTLDERMDIVDKPEIKNSEVVKPVDSKTDFVFKEVVIEMPKLEVDKKRKRGINEEPSDLKIENGIEELVKGFNAFTIEDLSKDAADIQHQIVRCLSSATSENAEEGFYSILELLRKFCEIVSKETYFGDNLRTVNCLKRALDIAEILSTERRFSPQVARQTYLKVLLTEFYDEQDVSKLSQWMTTILEDFPYDTLNLLELRELKFGPNECFALIANAKKLQTLDLSSLEDVQFFDKVPLPTTLKKLLVREDVCKKYGQDASNKKLIAAGFKPSYIICRCGIIEITK